MHRVHLRGLFNQLKANRITSVIVGSLLGFIHFLLRLVLFARIQSLKLWLVNFYHHVIPHAAMLLQLLHPLCSFRSPSDDVHWTGESRVSFKHAKQLVSASFLLAHPDPSAQLRLVLCDFSLVHPRPFRVVCLGGQFLMLSIVLHIWVSMECRL